MKRKKKTPNSVSAYRRCMECRYHEFAVDAFVCTRDKNHTLMYEAPKKCQYFIEDIDHLFKYVNEAYRREGIPENIQKSENMEFKEQKVENSIIQSQKEEAEFLLKKAEYLKTYWENEEASERIEQEMWDEIFSEREDRLASQNQETQDSAMESPTEQESVLAKKRRIFKDILGKRKRVG